MSHLDELDEFEAELELRLKREYTAVFGLFRYCVLTQDATYLCNRLDLKYVPQPSYPFFHLKLEDVWPPLTPETLAEKLGEPLAGDDDAS